MFWWSFILFEVLPTCFSADLWWELPWLLLLFFEFTQTASGVKLWRTCTWCVLASVDWLALILIIKTTSLSFVSSDHQLWGMPSTESPNDWLSSWRTKISAAWSGLTMPAAGVTSSHLGKPKEPLGWYSYACPSSLAVDWPQQVNWKRTLSSLLLLEIFKLNVSWFWRTIWVVLTSVSGI